MRDSMNLLIKEAKKRKIKFLCDKVPSSRIQSLKVFYDLGFKIVDSYINKKFEKDEEVLEIRKEL